MNVPLYYSLGNIARPCLYIMIIILINQRFLQRLKRELVHKGKILDNERFYF